MGSYLKRLAAGLLTAGLLAIPSAFAYDLSRVTEAVGVAFGIFASFFGINLTGGVLTGVAKGLFFLLFFAIFNWSARKFVFRADDPITKRTANIVAFVLAILGTYFAPAAYVTSMGSYWSMIAYMLLALLMPGVFVYLAFWQLNDSGGKHALGALLLIIGAVIIAYFQEVARTLQVSPELAGFKSLTETLLFTAWVIIILLIFVKLVQALTGFGVSTGPVGRAADRLFTPRDADWYRRRDETDRAREDWDRNRREREAERQRRPSQVSNVRFGSVPGGGTQVTWDPLTAEDRPAYYEIQVSEDPTSRTDNPEDSTLWRPATPATQRHPSGSIILNDVVPPAGLAVRVRAVNVYGQRGPFGGSNFMNPPALPTPTDDYINNVVNPGFTRFQQALGAATTQSNQVQTTMFSPLAVINSAAGPFRIVGIANNPAQVPARDAVDTQLAAAENELRRAATELLAIRNDARFGGLGATAMRDFNDYTRDYYQALARLARLRAVRRYAITI